MFDMIGSIISSLVNSGTQLGVNASNQNNATSIKNQNFADSRVANTMLSNYLKNGKVGIDQWNNDVSGQDYNDVADYMNPYLAINAVDMNKQAFEFNKNSFRENIDLQKDLAYNGAQIKANDYRKSGFNPLLAVGGSSSASPVSSGASAPSINSLPKNQHPMPNLSSSPTFNISGGDNLLRFINNQAQARVLNAQADKLEAETATEKGRPANLEKDTELKGYQIKNLIENTNLAKEQISTELSKQGLNKSQVEYYNKQIEALSHDIQLSKQYDIKTSEMIPYAWQQLSGIFETMGIDSDNPLYSWLMAASVGLITATGGKVSLKGNKGSKSFKEYSKDVPNDSFFFHDGKKYYKNKKGEVNNAITTKEF